MNRALAFALGPLLVASTLWLAAGVGAAPVQTGEPWPALPLQDQHRNPLPVTGDTRIVFFAAEMTASKLMGKVLEGLPPTTLRDRKAVYVADISGMPEPISTIVAVPRMQRLPYPVAVVRHAQDAARLPRRNGAVTVLRTEGGRVTAVEYARTAEQLGQYLR